jgi:hypothetical protein
MDNVLKGGKKMSSKKKSGTSKSKGPSSSQKKSSSKGKKSGSKKTNPWLVHVKKTMKEKPNLKFAEVLVLCKKTYKK